jgi:glutaredoxin
MSNLTDLYNINPSTVVMYSTTWCPDCKRSRRFMDGNNIKYLDIDIGKDTNAVTFLETISRARIHIPTIIFPDGTILIEPTDEELGRKLGINVG